MRVKERTGKAYKRDELPRSEDEKDISVVQGKREDKLYKMTEEQRRACRGPWKISLSEC